MLHVRTRTHLIFSEYANGTRGDTLVPLKETSFWATLPACDLSPQRPGEPRWLRRVVHPDNCGYNGSPLPQAGAPAATTSRAGRRYVMRDGYAITWPKASRCMFMLPTMSRWPRNRHWGFLHTQFRPRTLWRRGPLGHRLEVPRSEPVKLRMSARLHF